MAKAKGLSLKQKRFAAEYAVDGNGTRAARAAGYRGNGNVLGAVAHENLRKPKVLSEVEGELAKIAVDFGPDRVRARLHALSHGAEQAGHFGPAVRCEELIGKAAGMWIDQSLQLTGVLSDSHVAALVEHAKRRQLERIDNSDDDNE